MWIYDKKLQYPVNIKNPNPKSAKVIITQLGGPDGELAAATRYLSQRFAMPNDKAKGLLTDIGTSCTEMLHFLITKKNRMITGFSSIQLKQMQRLGDT